MPTKSSVTYFVQRSGGGAVVPAPRDSYPSELGTFYPQHAIQSLESVRVDSGPVSDYRYRISIGDNATSELFGTKVDMKLVEGQLAIAYYDPLFGNINYWYFSQGDLAYSQVSQLGLIGPTSTTADNRAKAKFIRKCSEAQSALQGQVVLGELTEALNMVRHPARSLRKGIDDYFDTLKKRRRGNNATKKKVLSDTWLEYMFGWRPLISDIEAGSKALDNIRSRRHPYQMIKVVESESVDVPTPPEYVPGMLSYYIAKKRYGTSTIVYRGIVNLNVNPGISMVAENLGFRWDQFVPSLWELVPYSFLVDYFTNIGDIIQSWSYASSNLRWVSKTVIDEFTIEHQTAGFSPDVLSLHPAQIVERIERHASSRSTARVVQRTANGGSLVPSLVFEVPGSDSLKWLNIAALATSQRRLTPY